MPALHEGIAVTLDRADEVLESLLAEYASALQTKTVTSRASRLSHDVCGLLRSALDMTARRYWDLHIAPDLSDKETNAALVYFPIAGNENGFNSTTGRWRWKDVKGKHSAVQDYLRSKQPFHSNSNRWLTIVSELAASGKHVDLIPQKHLEELSVGVAIRPGGSIRIGPGGSMRFGPQGVTYSGAVSTSGPVREYVERWVDLRIDGYDVSAKPFHQNACRDVRDLVQEMTDQFHLS